MKWLGHVEVLFLETVSHRLRPPHAKGWLIGKDSDAGRDWRQEEKGTTEDEMPGWHHWLDGHESEWTPGAGDGHGGLACCDSWVAKSRTRLSDWTELNSLIPHFPSRSCICTYLRLIPSFSDLNFPDIREILKNTKTEKLWSFPLGLTSPITQDRGYYKEKLGEKKRIFVSLYILKKHKN